MEETTQILSAAAALITAGKNGLPRSMEQLDEVAADLMLRLRQLLITPALGEATPELQRAVEVLTLFAESVSERLDELEQPTESMLESVVREGAKVTEPVLQQMLADLLESNCEPEHGSLVRPSFAQTVAAMRPLDARVLSAIWSVEKAHGDRTHVWVSLGVAADRPPGESHWIPRCVSFDCSSPEFLRLSVLCLDQAGVLELLDEYDESGVWRVKIREYGRALAGAACRASPASRRAY
jgi:hypothetical protein